MTMMRSASVVAGVFSAALGSASLAGDISCIGVQQAAAIARIAQLPEDQRREHGALLQFLQETAAKAQREMVAAEQAVNQDKQTLRMMNPGANEEEIERLWRAQVVQGGDADRNFAQHETTQRKLHKEEAEMIARSSQLVTERDRARMREISNNYVNENAFQLTPFNTSESLQRLISVMAASKAAAEGRDLDSSVIASIGIDRNSADPVLATAGALVRASIAANAVGARGNLILDHLLSQGMRDTQFRTQVVSGGGRTAQALQKSVARGLNDGLVQGVIQRKIASIVPPSPPASTTRDAPSLKGNFVSSAKKVAASVKMIVTWVDREVEEAVPEKVPAK